MRNFNRLFVLTLALLLVLGMSTMVLANGEGQGPPCFPPCPGDDDPCPGNGDTDEPAWCNGEGDIALIAQLGSSNTAYITQTGYNDPCEDEVTNCPFLNYFNNVAMIGQFGYGNTAGITQVGSDHLALVYQGGDCGLVHVNQAGRRNMSLAVQFGTSNTIGITQLGTNDVAIAYQDCGSNNVAGILQN